MKITIDTKEDSKEEIRKLIQMLSSVINNESRDVYVNKGNIFADDNKQEETEKVESAFGNMFNNDNTKESSEENKEEDSEEKKETAKEDISIDIPQVMEY